MIISFAWTTADFIAGRKTATRRFWNNLYAAKFPVGSVHKAYDKSPRFGGKQIGLIRITACFKQFLEEMTSDDLAQEGTLWSSVDEYVYMMCAQGKGNYPWVIKFEKLCQK